MELEHMERGVRLIDETTTVHIADVEHKQGSRHATIEVAETNGIVLLPETRLNLLDTRQRDRILGQLTAKDNRRNWDDLLSKIIELSRDIDTSAPPRVDDEIPWPVLVLCRA